MKITRRYPGTLAAALLWVVLVLLLYYWIHKPLTETLATRLGGALLDTGAAALLVLAGGGLGRRLRGLLLPDLSALSRPERLAADGLLGLGALSVLIFVVGLVNLSVVSMAALLVLIFAMTRAALLDWLREARALLGTPIEAGWNRGLAVFIGVNLGMAFIMALAPPTKFDALTYQLVGAKLWVAEGRFIPLEGNHFFAFPQSMNTLYSAHMALVVGRLTGAVLLHWSVGVYMLLGLGGYAGRQFSSFAGWVAPAIVLTATSFWFQFGWAYVDLAPAAYGMLAFICLDLWRVQKETSSDLWRWLALGGVYAGLAMSSKYNAVAVGIALSLFIAVYSWRDGLTSLVKNGLWFGVAASLVLAPWLLRNVAFYENPVYPFGPTTGEWDDLSNTWYFRQDPEVLRVNGWQLPLIFFTPTFLGVEGAPGFNATIGALFVLLIPFLLITWGGLEAQQKRALKSLLLLVGFGHLFWAYSSLEFWTSTRLVSFLFPWMALLAAAGLDSLRLLPEKPLYLAWLVRMVFLAVLSLTLLDHIAGQRPDDGTLSGTTLDSHFLDKGSLDYLMGMTSEEDYLVDELGWYVWAMEEVNRLPDDAQVLFLWETRTLYCDEPRITCIEDTVLMRWWRDRRRIGDGSSEALIEAWREEGITHVLVSESGRTYEFDGVNPLDESDFAEWERFTTLLPVHWQGEAEYTLYTLSEEEG